MDGQVQAYVFFDLQARKVADVVEAVNAIDGVTMAHAVTGRYDAIAYLEAEDFAELANDVLPQIRAVGGILGTETAVVIAEPREEL
jgi:DNA-binding Lrp family transcriptional regulator